MNRPTLWILCGLPFAGKTQLAEALRVNCVPRRWPTR